MAERKKSLLRLNSSSGTMMSPTPTPDANPNSNNHNSNSKRNLTIDTKEKSQSSLISGTPKLAPTSKTSTPQATSQISPPSMNRPMSTKNNNEEKQSIDQLDLPEVLIEAHAEIPSISPRDKLSYVEDKKAWKEAKQYEQSMAALNILIGEIESAVLTDKPDNIPEYIVEVFFGERNLIEVRKTIELRSQLIV